MYNLCNAQVVLFLSIIFSRNTAACKSLPSAQYPIGLYSPSSPSYLQKIFLKSDIQLSLQKALYADLSASEQILVQLCWVLVDPPTHSSRLPLNYHLILPVLYFPFPNRQALRRLEICQQLPLRRLNY